MLALLEELYVAVGELEIKGSVFYVPQEPWIFSASIKQNILFGKPFDNEKFRRIIEICCLKHVSHIILSLFYFFF